ncbi:MAG: HlyD family efflux transporter periplasmic adaptor subunit [Candidatus Pacebacteria bacterium]|nr:HlyD family efflux transporter periplasmic adaptor subunit [Candidatus Paceibacterota bacterium]MBP9840316.1 HlyD family efflux transporter periplasmic adaptor subunit [Candidatus Paceibacterota bacterium]
MAYLNALPGFLRRLPNRAVFFVESVWRTFRSLSGRIQALIITGVLIFVVAFFALTGGSTTETTDTAPAVSLESVGALSGGNGSATLFGSVESVSEAEILAKTSGTVTSVNTRIGASVPAGFVIASLENRAEAAAVLSAEGSYEAALAAKRTADANSGANVESVYNSSRVSIDTAVNAYIAPLYINPTVNPTLRLSGGGSRNLGERFETAYDALMDWRRDAQAGTLSDAAMLSQAEGVVDQLESLITDISLIANRENSNATATELANINTARSTIASVSASLRAARVAYESGTGATDISASDAAVKQALGGLRAAQAAYERTVVRAPIAGTVNFLPIKVGDYVTALTHAATVARNGALEITAYVSPESREALRIGDKVVIDEKSGGTITSIAPALDPIRKQIEVRIAADESDTLTNGQSVRVRLASAPKTDVVQGPILLPLSSVKLSAGSRVVFSVDEEMRLVAHPVEVGEVRGDRIEIRSELPLDLAVVRDARGLSAGQEIRIAGAE